MEYKRYRGRRRRKTFQTVCQVLALVGLLVTLAVGGADNTVSTAAMVIPLGVGIAMFAGFGYIGGLFH